MLVQLAIVVSPAGERCRSEPNPFKFGRILSTPLPGRGAWLRALEYSRELNYPVPLPGTRQLYMPTGQMKTLFILWTGAEPQTMSQLAQALEVSLGNVAGLIEGRRSAASSIGLIQVRCYGGVTKCVPGEGFDCFGRYLIVRRWSLVSRARLLLILGWAWLVAPIVVSGYGAWAAEDGFLRADGERQLQLGMYWLLLNMAPVDKAA